METNNAIVQNWDDLELHTDLLRGIYAYGFEKPSEIQKKAIYPIISKKDVIAQAQSGTGKTGSFSISSLQLVDVDIKETQILIIAPTRELASQIHGVITTLGSCMDGLITKLLVGGTSVQSDIESIKKNKPHVVVGCTGRIYDLMMRKKLNVHTVKLFVLDECDVMLSGKFKDQIYEIFQYFNQEVQVAVFSATLPIHVVELTDKFMRDPVKIIMKPEELSLDGIEQTFVAVENDNQKFETLKHLFSTLCVNQSIIYCNSVNRVVDLYDAMKKDGFSVSCIHSNMDKTDREDVFKQFRKGDTRVLISSDITARGIDIQQVSTVINFDITGSVHTYLHRIGRSGRYGRKGLAINFVTRNDIRQMKYIEDFYKIEIGELKA
tara:strand:+ start:1501 stop:2637 length:1137 start_codon:yes stop_codon:yes gene_type:complete